ncbi:protein FAR1-related sequence 5 [Tanacetum coccineum]
MNSSMCFTLIGRDNIYSVNPFPFIGKGIRVYKFNLDYVASIKWVVELPFNARLLSSTRLKGSGTEPKIKKLDALCTPESFVTHSNIDTPDGTVYYIPKVYVDVLLVKGNVYDSVDDCVVAYMKYVAEAGFVVRHSCQKRLRNGDVKQKYLVCNRKGCPKGIHVDTLDLENSDKQKRNSNLHITGCKACAVLNLDPRTRKFVLNMFDTIHNHELEHEEFKHLSKRERQLT